MHLPYRRMMHVIILNLRKTAWVMKFGLNESELFVVPSALAWLEFRVQLYFFLKNFDWRQ